MGLLLAIMITNQPIQKPPFCLHPPSMAHYDVPNEDPANKIPQIFSCHLCCFNLLASALLTKDYNADDPQKCPTHHQEHYVCFVICGCIPNGLQAELDVFTSCVPPNDTCFSVVHNVDSAIGYSDDLHHMASLFSVFTVPNFNSTLSLPVHIHRQYPHPSLVSCPLHY